MKSFYPRYVHSSYALTLLLLCLSSLVMVASYIRPNTTKGQWDNCRLSVQLQQKTFPVMCLQSDEYKKAKKQFKRLIQYSSECMDFNLLDESQEVTTDNLFINCYLSLEAKAVARSNSCFYENYYSPRYIFCPKLETINDITFDIWNICSEQIIYIEKDRDSQSTVDDNGNISFCDKETKNSIFKKIFDVVQSKMINSCQSFYEYSKLDQLGSYINFENHYKECFRSELMLDIARENECFFQKYFVPIFFYCARLTL